MTRHDLPRCPFCGAWPEDDDASGMVPVVGCANAACPISRIRMTETEWKQRPIEAAAEADLIHARAVGDSLRANLAQMRANFDAIAAIADGLEQNLNQLRGL